MAVAPPQAMPAVGAAAPPQATEPWVDPWVAKAAKPQTRSEPRCELTQPTVATWIQASSRSQAPSFDPQ